MKLYAGIRELKLPYIITSMEILVMAE